MRGRPGGFLLLYVLFTAALILIHAPALTAPYFWDELGQFVPAALDILQDGALVPHSTTPNVHPPGVMAYLAGVWSLAGTSVIVTRLAMLALAGAGVLFTFLCAIELLKGVPGLPAFGAIALLMASPLFWSQSMMAQLDMPAMTFTTAALWFFLRDRPGASAVACIPLVWVKETGALVPAVFGGWLWWHGRRRDAALFALPLAALAAWLAHLTAVTGHPLGNREFAHYNVTFQLHPVRIGMTALRRLYYLFAANFHWLGTIALFLAFRRKQLAAWPSHHWRVTALLFCAHTAAVTVLGGAALERYLLPVLPLLYIAVAGAASKAVQTAMAIGMFACWFVNPPYPFPFENNVALVDFVRLHQSAARYLEERHANSTVVSAWPFPDALRRSEFGYVQTPIRVRGIENFNAATVQRERGKGVEILVVYSRTWEPAWGLLRWAPIRNLLARFYLYEPQVTADGVAGALNLFPVARWQRRGQWIEIYAPAPEGVIELAKRESNRAWTAARAGLYPKD